MNFRKKLQYILHGHLKTVKVLCVVIFIYLFMIIFFSDFEENQTINPQNFPKEEKSEGKKKRLPQCIIFGAKKCGTTSLLYFLSIHPYLVINKREVHFFDHDKDNYLKGLEWYRNEMPSTLDHQITIEKTPNYFVSPEAPEQIRSMNSTIKLILIVCEPVRRTMSHYLHHKRSGTGCRLSFEECALTKNGKINSSYVPIGVSEYYNHMVRWSSVFARDQIHIVDGEKLIEDPYHEIEKIEKFLNIPPLLTPWNYYYDSDKGYFCFRTESFQKCIPGKGHEHPEVAPEVLAKLTKYYSSLNNKFYQLVGQEFNWN